MNQIERIKYMEEILNNSSKTVDELLILLDEYKKQINNIKELSSYYDSNLWRKDFTDDENGKLPQNLNRGVLSEDGIYDLLAQNTELIELMKEIITKTK